MHEKPLTSRVALVTGAGRNIGRAIALALAEDGAAVVINVRSNEQEATAVVDEVRAAGGQAIWHAADVSNRSAVDAMMERVRQTYGRLDILVNNAAVRDETPFDEMTYKAWRKALEICLDGAFHCTQAALPMLKHNEGAAVINIGGLTAHIGASHRTHVITAKAGLVGLTRGLAHELAPQGITVNCISPGMIDTQRDNHSGQPRHHGQHFPLVGRRGSPKEVAAAARWLAGPGGRYVTGQVIHVNGGLYLGG